MLPNRAELTWKQQLADLLLVLANTRGSLGFETADVYAFENDFARQFPGNQHIREKIRQTLQQLRDDGLVIFEARGRYRLNTQSDEFDLDTMLSLPALPSIPERTTQWRTIRLRNTLLAIDMKQRYEHTCQLCNSPLWISDGRRYAEAHHIRPLGTPHDGPDSPGNIIVLCPNHHVMFDRGALSLDPRTLIVRHRLSAAWSEPTRLTVATWHTLDLACVDYHNRNIFGNTATGE